MIEIKQGNLLDAPVEALVNTVNTVGVMGKGIALQFKLKYKENYLQYKKACKDQEVGIGKMFYTEIGEVIPKWIINFPTKKDFKHPSKLQYIESGLVDLVRVIKELNIKSIALPPLGAGSGKLDWEDVKPLIYKHLAPLEEVTIWLYEPTESIPQLKPSETQQHFFNLPTLTPVRSMILLAMDQYHILDFECSNIEIQKLVYFLQRLGEQFPKIVFQPYYYGPYAFTLEKVIADLEGKYLTGLKYNTARPFDEIQLIKEQLPEIRSKKEDLSPEQKRRLALLTQLIHQYESPFGLELLATVDWVVNQNPPILYDISAIQEAVYNWQKNPQRKRKLMPTEYLAKAQQRLMAFYEQNPDFYVLSK